MKYFTESEFNNFEMMDENLLSMLDDLREAYGHPIKLTSTYRSPDHPIEAKKSQPGAHASGRAVDVLIKGADALKCIEIALQHGITGLGVKQHGDSRFIHLDNLEATSSKPRPWVWSYE